MITAKDIYAAVQRREEASRHFRRWLGASVIGHPCTRHVALSFRSAFDPAFSGKILRVFENGLKAEDRIVADLDAAGMKIHSRQMMIDLDGGNGHAGATLDGVAEEDGQFYLLEMKTANAKSWAELARDGVQKAKPQHYAQMQFGMLLTQLDNALYVAENKDTNELHIERVAFHKPLADRLAELALRIIADAPGERCNERPDWWECKMCAAAPVCKGATFPQCHCLTCCHATAAPGATWACAKNENKPIPEEALCDGCTHHVFLPWIVNLPVVQYGDHCVCYGTPTGARIWNCPEKEIPPVDDGPVPVILPSADLENRTWGEVVAQEKAK